MIKWIAAGIGLYVRGFAGALVGFIIGSILDLFFRKNSSSSTGNSFEQVFKQTQRQRQSVSPGDFELNLLSLCSIVIKADGQVSQRELDYVRAYFVSAYGKERANATFRTFNEVIKSHKVESERICAYLHSRTSYEVRLQILHFLFGIAQADGTVSQAELNELDHIASYLRLNSHDFESIKAMFFKSADNAYKILEIEKSVSDAEVKKAYRTMVKKYHPDKLAHMDEAYKKGARAKFDKVQEAYDTIQNERGM